MLRTSQNIHPNNEWTLIKVGFYGEGEGSCISLTFSEQDGSQCHVAVHYNRGNPKKFVEMFKEAASKLEMPQMEEK